MSKKVSKVKKGISERHRKVADLYLTGKYSMCKAYEKVYKTSGYSSNANSNKLFKRKDVIEYIEKRQEVLAEKMDVKKEDLAQASLDLIQQYFYVSKLAIREDLSDEEKEVFKRLSLLVKASDMNRAVDILNRMYGFNEPDKLDLTNMVIEAKFQ